MIENATWTDGTSLTAEDAAFSLNYYRDTAGNPYGIDLAKMTRAVAGSTYTLIVEFETESFRNLHRVAYKPIIPKRIFEDRMGTGWQEYNPNPPEVEMVTSGPFNVSEYVAGEYLELSRKGDYPFLPETATETTRPTSNNTEQAILFAIGLIAAATAIFAGYKMTAK